MLPNPIRRVNDTRQLLLLAQKVKLYRRTKGNSNYTNLFMYLPWFNKQFRAVSTCNCTCREIHHFKLYWNKWTWRKWIRWWIVKQTKIQRNMTYVHYRKVIFGLINSFADTRDEFRTLPSMLELFLKKLPIQSH